MSRASSIVAVVCITALLTVSVSATANEGTEQGAFARAYAEAVQAEHQLLLTLADKEKSRLGALQQLREGGHASWLEVRQQQLTFDQRKVASEAYGNLKSFVEELETVSTPKSWNRKSIGQLPFTDLMLHSSNQGDDRLDAKQLAQNLQLLVNKQTEARDKLELALKALKPSDPWKKGYAMKLRVANARLTATKAQVQLVETFQVDNDSAIDPTGELAASVLDADLVDSLCSQCEAHDKLIQHVFETESLRQKKLNELKSLGMATQRDIDQLAMRQEELKRTRQLQRSVVAFLNEVGAKVDTNSSAESRVSAAVQWDLIRNQFLKMEATTQLEYAKLEKEMLVEILRRLEVAASATHQKNSEPSKSLVAGQQAELESYRRKIERTELRMKLAVARQQVLDQHKLSGVHTLAFNRIVSDNHGSSMSLHKTEFGFGTYAMLGGILTNSNGISSESSNANAILPYVGFGSYATCPIRFGNLYGGYHIVRLSSNRYPLQLNSTPSLSLGDSGSMLSLTHRATKNTLLPKHDYGSPYLSRKPLPMFHRPYQNGILRTEYRQFLTPGQPPWLLPGSPTNLRYKQFRYN